MMMSSNRRLVHGSYISDYPRWKYQKDITADEAAFILSIPQEERDTGLRPCDNCKGTRKIKGHQCWDCRGTGKEREYLWLNKGFIVVGQENVPADHLKYENGMQAVYIHDGNYRLFSYVPLADLVS